MEFLCILVVLLFVVLPICLSVYGTNLLRKQQEKARRRLNTARHAYQSSLEQLREHPTDPELRQKTLDLGRYYSGLTREENSVTIFDEIALKNDIDAACAGAVNLVTQPQPLHAESAPIRDERECPFCAELILKKAIVCKHCQRELTDQKTSQDERMRPAATAEHISVACRCGKRLKVNAKHRGKRAKCPSCNEPIEIPRHD